MGVCWRLVGVVLVTHARLARFGRVALVDQALL